MDDLAVVGAGRHSWPGLALQHDNAVPSLREREGRRQADDSGPDDGAFDAFHVRQDGWRDGGA